MKPTHQISSLASLLLLLTGLNAMGAPAPAPKSNDNWPQFRGLDAAGVSENSRLPDRWSATENVAWKTDIAGRAWSSPIVWGDRVFLTSVVNLGESEPPKQGL